MRGFGIRSSIWTMSRTPDAAERAVAEAVRHGFDFVEIALLDPPMVDAAHSKALLEKANMRAVCSLGLPEAAWPSRDPEAGVTFLTAALDKAAAIGAEALTGVTFGGIGRGVAGHRPKLSWTTSRGAYRRRQRMRSCSASPSASSR